MTLVDAGMIAVHLVFAALWVGAVVYVAIGVLPLARDGGLDREPLGTLVNKAVWISRIGALALIVTGSHLMGTRGYFDTDVLLGTGRGLAIGTMLLSWLILIVLVEVGSRRIQSGLRANLVREPARDGRTWFLVGGIAGIVAFLAGALVTTGAV